MDFLSSQSNAFPFIPFSLYPFPQIHTNTLLSVGLIPEVKCRFDIGGDDLETFKRVFLHLKANVY